MTRLISRSGVPLDIDEPIVELSMWTGEGAGRISFIGTLNHPDRKLGTLVHTGNDVYRIISRVADSLTEERCTAEFVGLLRSLEPAKRPFDIGSAVTWLKAGHRVSREGWNGKGMWLVYVPALSYAVDFNEDPHMDVAAFAHMRSKDPEENPESYQLLPFVAMKTADGRFVPWLASQTDLLAEDWGIVS